MEITDSLIREMRQMGQPCDVYQKRYCPQSEHGARRPRGVALNPLTQVFPEESTDIPQKGLPCLVLELNVSLIQID